MVQIVVHVTSDGNRVIYFEIVQAMSSLWVRPTLELSQAVLCVLASMLLCSVTVWVGSYTQSSLSSSCTHARLFACLVDRGDEQACHLFLVLVFDVLFFLTFLCFSMIKQPIKDWLVSTSIMASNTLSLRGVVINLYETILVVWWSNLSWFWSTPAWSLHLSWDQPRLERCIFLQFVFLINLCLLYFSLSLLFKVK